MGKSLHRFLSFFLALFLAANLALPAGATEGWHIGMKANELTHFLKEGISVIKGRVISIKEMGMTDPESGNFQWFSPWPVNKMTVQVEEVLWGKLFRYQVTCETEADPAPGAEIVIRLQAPEESFAESRQWYLEYYSMEKHAQEYAYSDYEADWVLELNRDKFIYPAYNYFWSSEVEDLQTLRALLSGALQAPYPAESPDNQLSLYPSVYYYELDYESEDYDTFKVGYARMQNRVVTAKSAPVHDEPKDTSYVLHQGLQGEILLDCGYPGPKGEAKNPFPGWRKVLLASEPHIPAGYSMTEGYVREEYLSEGQPLPYGSYLVTMTQSVYLLKESGKVDKSHVLAKGTVQAVCAQHGVDNDKDSDGEEALLLLTFQADEKSARRYLRQKYTDMTYGDHGDHLPSDQEIVSTKEAIDSGWRMDPLLMPPDWAPYKGDY